MSIYRYGDEEYNDSISANRVRNELERQSRMQSDFNANLESFDKEEEKLKQKQKDKDWTRNEYKRMYDQEMKHFGMPKGNDQLSKEIRATRETDQFISGYVLGMASAISSYAKEEMHCRNVEQAIKDLGNIHEAERNARMDDLKDTQTRKLDELHREVAARIENASASSNAYYVEFHDKRAEAELTIKKADESYAASKKHIDRDERAADDAYKKVIGRTDENIKKADDELLKYTKESEANRDSAIKRANDDYKRAVSEIKQNYSGADCERKIQAAEMKRNDIVRKAEETHNKTVETRKTEYNEKVEAVKEELRVATEKHNQKIERIAERRDEIKIKRDTVVNHQNDVIREAQIKYKNEIQTAQKEATNAQLKRDSYLGNQTIIEQRNAAMAESSSINVIRPTGKTTKDAVNYVTMVNSNQTAVGAAIASSIGTNEEKAVIRKIEMDRAEAAKAKAEGKVFTSSLSRDDKKAYEEIIRKHVGDISTENNIKTSIQKLDSSIVTIRKTVNSNENALNALKIESKQIDAQIAAINKNLAPVREAKQMLETGKNAEGRKLTKAESAELRKTIKDAGNLEAQIKDLKALQNKKQENANMIKSTEAKNDVDKHALFAAAAQKATLEKNGKVIAETLVANKSSKGLLSYSSIDKDMTKAQKAGIVAGNVAKYAAKSGLVVANIATFGMAFKNAKANMEAERNVGKSEAQIKAKAAAQKRIKQSSDKLQQKSSLLLQKDNAIHYEIMSQGRNVKAFVTKVNNNIQTFQNAHALFIKNARGIKIINNQFVKKENKIAEKIANNNGKLTLGMRAGNLAKGTGKFVGKTALGTAGIVAGFMTLPQQIAAMPNKMLNFAMHEAGRGASNITKATGRVAYRTTRKVGGAVIHTTGKVLGKGYNATIGRGVNKLKGAVVGSRAGQAAKKAADGISGKWNGFKNATKETKLYKKAADWVTRAKAKMPAFVKTTFTKIGTFFHFLFGGWKEFLVSCIIGLLTLLLHLAIILLGAAVVFVLVMTVLIVFFALLASLVTAILNLWQQAFAQNQSYVKNNPEFIINQAVNYRNAELDIYNLFLRANLPENEDDTTGTINNDILYPSTDPIYHSLYDKRFNLKKLFSWFKPVAENTFLMDAKNEKAKETKDKLNDIVKAFPYNSDEETQWQVKDLGELGLATFKSNVKGYQAALLNYYHMEEKGQKGTTRSRYEISNTKAAVSLVDALYVDNPEEMQKVEVVAYLGVGDYQPANASDEAEKSLFWMTHEVNYNEGNAEEDIWFHMTVQQDGGRNFIVNNNKAYYPKAKTTGNTHSAGAVIDPVCNCSEATMKKYEITITHKVKETYTDTETVYAGHSESSCPNWNVVYGCSCTETVEVEKERWVDEDETIAFDVCTGHILLDARIDVASLKGPSGDDEKLNLFFELAQDIQKQDETNSKALITINKDTEIWGFGGMKTHAYNPEKDWEEDSDLCNLARLKNEAEYEYDATENQDIGKIACEIKQNKGAYTFDSLSKSQDNKVLFNVLINTTQYRLPSFVDGEQKKIPAYEGETSNTLTDVTTGMTIHGIPLVY